MNRKLLGFTLTLGTLSAIGLYVLRPQRIEYQPVVTIEPKMIEPTKPVDLLPLGTNKNIEITKQKSIGNNERKVARQDERPVQLIKEQLKKAVHAPKNLRDKIQIINYKRMPASAGNATELYYVSVKAPINERTFTTYQGLIDPKTDKFVKTWGHPVWERHPLAKLKFNVVEP